MSYKEELKKAKKEYLVLEEHLIEAYIKDYIGKYVYEYNLANGSIKRCEQILKRGMNGDAVVIIPVTTNNKLLMIIESRPVIKENIAFEFPMGMVDKCEAPLFAAKRELLEETGYTTDDIEEIEWHYQDQGCSKAKIHTYLAKNCIKVNEQSLEENELIKCFLVSFEELEQLLNEKNSYINDANTKIAVYKYKDIIEKRK